MFVYRVVVLTVPPNFQYQNEKQWAANQRFCSMKIWMYKRSSLVEQHFLFSTEIWAEQLIKTTLYILLHLGWLEQSYHRLQFVWGSEGGDIARDLMLLCN